MVPLRYSNLRAVYSCKFCFVKICEVPMWGVCWVEGAAKDQVRSHEFEDIVW